MATSKVDLDYSRVLHVAPEPELEKFLVAQSDDYLSIDLYVDNVMAKMDITDLDLPDDSKTLVWISHVLEHVERDDLAISEIYRVLCSSGIAFVQIPVWREKTYEDFAVQSETERLRVFYQPDHVRLYGLDVKERFERVGFDVSVVRAQDFGPDLIQYGLSFASTNEVFILKKP
ncbi:class I SAM-dependent methyltransferase [Mariniblastus sp.]|nr:class I SAM-dependent methyltransferase [Mariniblastus sp.]